MGFETAYSWSQLFQWLLERNCCRKLVILFWWVFELNFDVHYNYEINEIFSFLNFIYFPKNCFLTSNITHYMQLQCRFSGVFRTRTRMKKLQTHSSQLLRERPPPVPNPWKFKCEGNSYQLGDVNVLLKITCDNLNVFFGVFQRIYHISRPCLDVYIFAFNVSEW